MRIHSELRELLSPLLFVDSLYTYDIVLLFYHVLRECPHRGEPTNEEADIQADKAISGKDVPTEWHDRTNRAVFTWQEPRRKGGTVSYEDRNSTWNSGVRKTVRRGSAEEEVRKHRNRVTGAWKQISKQRRRVDVSYDPSMVTALQHGTGWMRWV